MWPFVFLDILDETTVCPSLKERVAPHGVISM